MCDLIHNINYSYDGKGIMFLNVLGTVFDMLSECVMTLLILMLANGWYSRYKNYDLDDGLEIYAPLFMLVLMIHIVFGALSFIDQDAHHKYHDFHGWVGYCLIIAKFILVGVMFYFYSHSADKIQRESQ
jgi:hypothetical protein